MYPASLCLFLLFVLHSVITEALRTLLSHQSARRYDGDVAFLLAFPVLTSHLKVLQNNVFGHLLTHRCSPCCPSWHSWILLSTIDLIWSLYAALRATQKTLWSLIWDARVSNWVHLCNSDQDCSLKHVQKWFGRDFICFWNVEGRMEEWRCWGRTTWNRFLH